MIPYFPSDANFVRLQCRESKQGMQVKLANDIIMNYRGPLYSLSSLGPNTASCLRQMNLVEQGACSLIKSNLVQTKVTLCPLQRVNGP